MGSLDSLDDKSKKGEVIGHEIEQNPGNFKTFILISPENFD